MLWLYIITILILCNGVAYSATGPKDTIAKIGDTVEFTCQLNSGSDLIWKTKTLKDGNSDYETIYYEGIKNNYINRMYVNPDNGSLIIYKVENSDFGTFRCRDANEKLSNGYKANLYVIDNFQFSAKVGKGRVTDFVKINDVVTVSCSLDYLTSLYMNTNDYPRMVINAVRKNDKSGTNKLAATDKENAIIYSMLNYTVKQQDKELVFTCSLDRGNPSYDYSETLSLNIERSITKVEYKPQLEQYTVGDTINCTSDGYPTPTYRWSSIRCPNCEPPRSGAGALLVLTTGNIGNNEYKCIATRRTSSGAIKTSKIDVKFTVVGINTGGSGGDPNQGGGKGWKIAVGIIVPLILITIIAVVVFFVLRRRKQNNREKSHSSSKRSSQPMKGYPGPYDQSIDVPVTSTGGDMSVQYPGKNSPGYADLGIRHMNQDNPGVNPKVTSNPNPNQKPRQPQAANNNRGPPSNRNPQMQSPQQSYTQGSRNPSMSSLNGPVPMGPGGPGAARPNPQAQQRNRQPGQQRMQGDGYTNAMYDPSPRHQSSTVSQGLDGSVV